MAINRAIKEQVEARNRMRRLAGIKTASARPCIFISHQKDDSVEAKEIADYILSLDIDVYFDEYDENLNDETRHIPKYVVSIIGNALRDSTHLISIISEKTLYSWWMPYEIGFASGKDIPIDQMKTVRLKNLDASLLPDYINIIEILETYYDLDVFLFDQILGRATLLVEHLQKTANRHPLSNIMN